MLDFELPFSNRNAYYLLYIHNTRLLVFPSDQLIALCHADTTLGHRLMYNLAADLAMKVRYSDLRSREQSKNQSPGTHAL
jgi:hypothetical protein